MHGVLDISRPANRPLDALADHPAPALRERGARLLEVLARLIADQIDRERQQRREARLEGEATAGQALLAALKARERYTAALCPGVRRAQSSSATPAPSSARPPSTRC